jgi:thymidylate synthase (FAD)
MNQQLTNHSEVLEKHPTLLEPIPVLDGFVRLVDWMGSDDSIADSARVSYGKGTRQTNDNTALVDYLIRHQHTSPLEMVEFKFHVKCPIFIARQWFRHRTASVNEVSARYSLVEDRIFSPSPEDIRGQSTHNKQVGQGVIDQPDVAAALMESANQQSYETYEKLLALGVCREQARSVLPTGTYTEFYWKQDLNNLLRLVSLRIDKHAQLEIQEYAKALRTIIQAVTPNTWKSFENHVVNAAKFSQDELELVRSILQGREAPLVLTGRRKAEFEAKLLGT